jgi:predicted nucleotidyltransferase
MITDDQLQDIVESIRNTFTIRQIHLFGSQARGDDHQHSDLNLCVIVAQDSGQPVEEWPSKSWLYRAAEISQRVGTDQIAVSPYVLTEGEFEALRQREHPLVGQILEEGRVVYEQ